MSRSGEDSEASETLHDGLQQIDQIATELDVPEYVQEAAGTLYTEAVEADVLWGNTVETIAPASLYAACRRMDIPRSTADFQDITAVKDGEIESAYRKLSQELELEIEPVPPNLFVARYCNELELEEDVEDFANELIEAAVEQNVHSGKSPTAVAAGAIYAASKFLGKEITQETIAEVCENSTVSIRNRYQELIEAYQEEE